MAASADARLITRKLAALLKDKGKLDSPEALALIDGVLAGRKGLTTSQRLAAARASRRKVLHERNMALLWAFAASGVLAHTIKVDDPGDWNRVLCVHTTLGQLHWKLSPEDQEDFETLGKARNDHNETVTPAEKLEWLEKMHKVFPPR